MIIFLSIIGLSLVILVHELGHFLAAKAAGVRVDEFGIGFPPRLWSRTVGETTYSVNALPFGGFVRIHGEQPAGKSEEEVGDEPERRFGAKPLWKRIGILLAGVAMNVLFGFVILTGVFAAGAPEHLIVGGVSSGSPAAEARIVQGDVIARATWGETALADPIDADAFVALARSAAGKTLSLELTGAGGTRTVTLVGRATPPPGEGSLGIALTSIGFPALPIHQAIAEAFFQTFRTLGEVASSFWYLLTNVFTEPGVLQKVSGPVGIVSFAVRTGELGAVYFFQLLALISLNLVILNLIPFPALDGGRVLVLLVEKLIRRPIPRRVQIAINGVGFAALLLLMAIVTVQDVGKLL
ncbi:MAG: site-2 protease family protein [bacterium]|nr:site-2 protease family protein [bacterium]